MENKKTFYMGSGDFSSMVLDKIHRNFSDLSVITQENKNLPILEVVKKHNIKLFKIKNKTELESLLKKRKPEINIVCDFGVIITKETLECNNPIINIHPSILPKYRGCSPIISAILNDDEYTGVSLMKMDEKVDEGPVYKIAKVKMTSQEDIFSLSKKLSTKAVNLIIDNIKDISSGKITPKAQIHKKSICTNMISKEQGLLDTKENAEIIERKIRAYKKWPGVFTYIKANGKKLLIKIAEAEVTTRQGQEPIYVKKNSLDIKTAKNYLSIKRIQPEGKKEMDVKDFLCGYKKIELTD